MADFNTAYENTGGYEGGYSNHAADRGGETWCGIARKFHPNWEGWKIIDEYKKKPGFPTNLKDISQLTVLRRQFYRELFWDAVWGDHLASQTFANSIYGEAVNFGVSKAIKMSQEACVIGFDANLTSDQVKEKVEAAGYKYGKMDEKTLNLFNAK